MVAAEKKIKNKSYPVYFRHINQGDLGTTTRDPVILEFF